MTNLFLIILIILLALLGILLLVWYLTYKSTLSMKTPIPNFHFDVEFGVNIFQFSEVAGLDVEIETIEYRDGNSPEYKPTKMPGQHKFSNIVLKRGMVKGDNEFFEWIHKAMARQPERRDIRIRLLDEEHKPIFIWKINNAFPVKYSGPPLKSDGNEVAIETLEITHEGFVVEAL